ncbi:heavy-metal-associated domain-containing protein [Flavobacterium agricola]|uniref:Heavy-metal-associated domain-containing protein n=1 Tax=Flavobacterium agricola TaxID=2870839 RepID=A0ABY6LYS8_9FLAO|nr:heavy-metal-associated domain-containing protein [Flavobacterium agricola]UYW00702.1 heavy-metal-associated domain-containing protein [Flavobacterium agricola]
MKKVTYKSNINCGSCVAKVTPVLNQLEVVKSWHVDTDNPAKLLTIESEDEVTDEVKAALRQVGFKIEKQ